MAGCVQGNFRLSVTVIDTPGVSYNQGGSWPEGWHFLPSLYLVVLRKEVCGPQGEWGIMVQKSKGTEV